MANPVFRRVAAVLAVVGGLGPLTAPPAPAASAKPAVCKEAAAFHAALAAIADLSSPKIPAAAKALHPALLRFRSAAGRAPAAIRTDWQAMAGALAKIDAALQKAVDAKGKVDSRARDALYTLMRTLDADPSLNRSAKAVDRWLAATCGLTPHYATTTLAAGSPPPSTGTGATTRR